LSPVKKILYKTGIHNWLMMPVNKLLAGAYFIKLCKWISVNRHLEVNDFPTKIDYKKRYIVHNYIADTLIANKEINYLEFGTADCETFIWWLQKNTNPASRFYGFDTFTGLPEDWGIYKKGAFDLQGKIPEINDKRAQLFKGLFQDTLHDFLKGFSNENPKVILLDADLYSATLFVLTTLAPLLRDGDIIIFDEFSSQQHEYLAYENFRNAFPYVKLKCFAASNNYSCVAFKVNIEH